MTDRPPTVGEAATRLSWHRATASDAEHLAHRDALIAAARADERRVMRERVESIAELRIMGDVTHVGHVTLLGYDVPLPGAVSRKDVLTALGSAE